MGAQWYTTAAGLFSTARAAFAVQLFYAGPASGKVAKRGASTCVG